MSISLDIQNDVALISMDDGKANAINFALMEELNEALDQAEASRPRGALLRRLRPRHDGQLHPRGFRPLA